jgi:hypothetical protein
MEPNGVVRFGTWATTIAVTAPLIATIFYVGFLSKTNSDAIALQIITNQMMVTEISALRSRVQAQELALNEVETQFCAQDIVRNLMHANDLREIAMMWQKLFDQRFPTDNAFYPTICNRKTP